MAVDKKFFVDINLQGNALNNATIGTNSDMTKGGSFQYASGTGRLEYYDDKKGISQLVANLSDISAVTGGLILQGGYNADTNTPDITDGTAEKGFFWVVTAAGSFLGESVQVGDSLVATVNSAGASIGDWLILQGNVVIATDSVDGIVRLGTQAEVDAGTEGGAVVLTPATFANSSQLSTITNNIAGNTKDIQNNSADITKQGEEIKSQGEAIKTNTEAIAENTKGIQTNSSEIAKNSQNIVTNSEDIKTNTAAIEKNTSSISENTQAIGKNSEAIQTNTSDITKNTADITTNTEAIAGNTKSIKEQEKEIAVVKGRVDTLETDKLSRDGSQAMTGTLDMGANLISNVAEPVSDQDAATKKYVDSQSFSATYADTDWTFDGNKYVLVVNHNLNSDTPKVSCFNSAKDLLEFLVTAETSNSVEIKSNIAPPATISVGVSK